MGRRASTKVEEFLRSAGILVMALALPFVLLYLVAWALFGLVAPNYARSRNAQRQSRNATIRQWQTEQLALLRSKTYADLSALPERTEVSPPPHLAGERFELVRAPGDSGGVEIGIAHTKRFMGLMLQMKPSFEILPNGTIVEQDHEPDD